MPPASHRLSTASQKNACRVGHALRARRGKRLNWNPSENPIFQPVGLASPPTAPPVSVVLQSELDEFLATTLSSQNQYVLEHEGSLGTDFKTIPEYQVQLRDDVLKNGVPIPRRPVYYCSDSKAFYLLASESFLKRVLPDVSLHISNSASQMQQSDLEHRNENQKPESASSHLLSTASTSFKRILIQLTPKELEKLETEAFFDWRRCLATIENCPDLQISPFEKNLDIWRQLWRVVEKCQLLLIILDGRYPNFFRSKGLEAYIKEVDATKQIIIVLNKADFLSRKQRNEWIEYFQKQEVEIIFFSALQELCLKGLVVLPTKTGQTPTMKPELDLKVEEEKTHEEETSAIPVADTGFGKHMFEYGQGNQADILNTQALHELLQKKAKSYEDFLNKRNRKLTKFNVGFIGFPNVGKSSMINALSGSKVVSVSRQPGKTKHFQTLASPLDSIIFCDCPGLVFTSATSTNHHLLLYGVLSPDHYRGGLVDAIQLICDRIPLQLSTHYEISITEDIVKRCVSMDDSLEEVFRLDAQKFCEQLAFSRKYISGGKGGLPDVFRACRLIIREYCNGNLLFCYSPDENDHAFKPSLLSKRDLKCSDEACLTDKSVNTDSSIKRTIEQRSRNFLRKFEEQCILSDDEIDSEALETLMEKLSIEYPDEAAAAVALASQKQKHVTQAKLRRIEKKQRRGNAALT